MATNLNPFTGRGLGPVESGVRDVLFVLETFGVERCDLIGASFGSCVVAQLSQTMPERVRRQLWVAPPIVRHLPWLGAFGPGWLYGGALMKFAPPRFHDRVAQYLEAGRHYAPEPDLDRTELRLLAGRVSDTSLAPFFRRLGGLLSWDWRRLQSPAERPLRVVQGRLEHAVSPPGVLEPLARLAGQPPVVMPGRHMPYLSFPEEFNRIARDHFDAESP